MCIRDSVYNEEEQEENIDATEAPAATASPVATQAAVTPAVTPAATTAPTATPVPTPHVTKQFVDTAISIADEMCIRDRYHQVMSPDAL